MNNDVKVAPCECKATKDHPKNDHETDDEKHFANPFWSNQDVRRGTRYSNFVATPLQEKV